MGRRLLIIGWPPNALWELIEGLRGFAAPGTHVTVVIPEDTRVCNVPQLTEDDNITMDFIRLEVRMGGTGWRE